MDIKAKIEEITNKVKSDPEFAKKLLENPAKTVKEVTGVDLPEEQVNAIIAGVKAKAPELVKNLKENPVKAVEAILPDSLKGLFPGGKK